MTNPKARLLATKRRTEAKQRCKAIVRAEKDRQSAKARRSLTVGFYADK